jgi:hypothetical protein
VIEVGPGDEVEAALNALQPGDELVLRGGMYELEDAWHLTIEGTEAAPIIVRAKQGERPHLHRASTGENLIDFDRVQHVEWRGIEHSGGSHGLRLIDASFMTIEDCEIHGTADVALSANSGGDYESLIIRLNHIHDTHGTGEGMYLGCHDASCAVHDSLIEGNYIHHTNADDVEQGDGIELKEGSYANVVRDNVIHDTNYPCIISYSTAGNGAPNVIERNLLWACGDNAIQSAADAVIRNNVILGAGASGIANQPHANGTPSNLVIVHNTILAPDNSAIASSGITGSVLIANNAVYARSGSAIRVAGQLAQVTVRGNVGAGGLAGAGSGLLAGDLAADFVAASYSNALPNDVFPKAGSALIGMGSAADVIDHDFNGSARSGAADVGAYRYDAQGNPGWDFAAAFKPAAGGDPIAGAGGAVAGNGAGGGTAGAAGSGGGTGRPAPGAGSGGNAGNGGSAGRPSAGAGGASGASSAGRDGGVTSDAGSAAGDDDSGCSCRAAGARSSPPPIVWSALALLALVQLGARRRRRPFNRRGAEDANPNSGILLLGVFGALAVKPLLLLLLITSACSDDDSGPDEDAVEPSDASTSASGRGGDGGRGGGGGGGRGGSAGSGTGGGGSGGRDGGGRDSGRPLDGGVRNDGGMLPAPDAGPFAKNPRLSGLADNTALDLGRFSCLPVPGEAPEMCRLATDYSGFVYDPHHHAMLSFGGGHATTMTDSVHVLDLGGALTWTDAYAPTPCASMNAGNLDEETGAWLSGASGPYPRPVSTHTYDMLAVAPQLDELIVIARTFTGGNCNPVGNDIGGKVAHYDRRAGTWSFSATANGSTNDLAGNLPGSEPDPISGKIVLFGVGGLSVYDPATRVYTHVADSLPDADGNDTQVIGTGYANHLVYFPPDDRFYFFVRNRPVDVYALRFDRAQPAQSTVERVDSSGPTTTHDEPGYDYDAVNQVIGGGVQDSTFFAFDPATRSWSAHAIQGGDPGNQAFHALAYDPVDNVFVFVTDYDSGQHTWAYRLAQ